MVTHDGACHCGRIRFELDGNVSSAMVCNCTLCSGVGAVWFGIANADLRFLQSLEEARVHQFGTMTAKHYFCPGCGLHPFSRPRIAPHAWIVNLRCVPSADISSLVIKQFDGRDWDAAAESLPAGRASRAPQNRT